MILKYILWIVLVLGLVIGAYSRSVTSYARSTGQITQIVQARVLAKAGIEAGLEMLTRVRTGLLPTTPAVIELEQGQIKLWFEDEAGKIDVNYAPIDLIAAAVRQVSSDTNVSPEVMNGIIDKVEKTRDREGWISKPGWLFTGIEGYDPDLIKISDIFTAYSGLAYVDPSKSSPRLARLLNQFENTSWIGSASGKAYRITSMGVSSSGSHYVVSAVFTPRPLKTPPFKLAAWDTVNNFDR